MQLAKTTLFASGTGADVRSNRRRRFEPNELSRHEDPPAITLCFHDWREIELAQTLFADRLGGAPDRPAAIAEQQQRPVGETRRQRRIVECRNHGVASVCELAEKT